MAQRDWLNRREWKVQATFFFIGVEDEEAVNSLNDKVAFGVRRPRAVGI